MRSTIEMAREAKAYLYCSPSNPYKLVDIMFTPETLKTFEALVRADEREAVIGLLRGIDETEIESADGWWETSTGAEFGAGRIAAIRARGETK
jgi:hypothetical protein